MLLTPRRLGALRITGPDELTMFVYETSARVGAGIEQLPLPLGDDFDGATDHFDRRLVVDCVRRNRQTGRPDLRGGHRVVWHRLVVQVREHCEVDEAQRS